MLYGEANCSTNGNVGVCTIYYLIKENNMNKNYYNINDLMTFSIEGTKAKLDYVNRQYSYFKVDSLQREPDIIVKVGPFNENDYLNDEYEIVNRKYKVSGDCIFAEDKYKVAKFKFLIQDLYKKQTHIYFDGNYWGYYILYKFFIEPVIRFKLNALGYFMIHSSSVFSNGNAYVFPASPSVGKTSTMLNWLHKGKGFIADEYTIFSKDAVYSYPTPLRLHDYNLKANPYVCEDMKFKDKFQIYLRTWIFRLTLGYGDVTHEVDIWNVFKDVNIVDKSTLGRIIVFTKYSGKDVRIKKISKEQFVSKLLTIDWFETTRFNEYLEAYYYVNNIQENQKFWNKMRNNIEEIFKDEEYEEYNIPAFYTEETFKQMNSILPEEK